MNSYIWPTVKVGDTIEYYAPVTGIGDLFIRKPITLQELWFGKLLDQNMMHIMKFRCLV